MSILFVKLRTVIGIGLLNILRVAYYRLGVLVGFNPVHRLQGQIPVPPFYVSPLVLRNHSIPLSPHWQKNIRLFSYWSVEKKNKFPDWLANPLTGQAIPNANRPWWQIPDFDPRVGDIKLIWELSRFDWVLVFAQRAAQGDSASLDQLNDWLRDWCEKNPPYLGPNWKCGQEASIRVLHLAMATILLKQSPVAMQGLINLIRLHLCRIAPTLMYAIAQDNNHGTSEAAALFVGGSWLCQSGITEGDRWMRMGRKWLENRASRLIGDQGTFSQYSLNYHRVLLDTFCMVEVWRRQLALPEFSVTYKKRTLAATQWLRHMINPSNGDGPNVGANDGARLIQLSSTPYRDYRPTVQLALALFGNEAAYEGDGSWNEPLKWLDIDIPKKVANSLSSYVADDGGFAMLRKGNAMAMLRYPRFKFRPSQADALHLDLWVDSLNLLRDAGSYSYNTDEYSHAYFNGTAGHNTVQFDDRDQMPRLSRFLFGDWLKTDFLVPLVEDGSSSQFAAGYTDAKGVGHRRHILLRNNGFFVLDEVSGFRQKAVLRWRLVPGDWRVVSTEDGVQVSHSQLQLVLSIKSSVPIVRVEIIDGWESKYYLERNVMPVIEFEVKQPGTLSTELNWFL